ncbi:uncharacterized protein LOC102808223 [Saccoglossus kowalevskii]|uniref:GDP-fucose protein O-fucosyltransferase 2 n=1 Tax=Saccoglossus kowalevskii TaxID=10224 RepID=A0ABM0MEH2_SACKO|nr:PREDICTED: uncharacterized protein LOC102808223 [Saccoglossus kowalevskii]
MGLSMAEHIRCGIVLYLTILVLSITVFWIFKVTGRMDYIYSEHGRGVYAGKYGAVNEDGGRAYGNLSKGTLLTSTRVRPYYHTRVKTMVDSGSQSKTPSQTEVNAFPAKTFSPRSRTGYLLPVIHKGGQNVQFNSFKKAAAFALLRNRTIVLTPFFFHGGDERGWTIQHWREFNMTFDTAELQKIVPVATLSEFKRECDGKMKALITSHYRIYKANLTLNRLLHLKPVAYNNTVKTSRYVYDKLIFDDEPCLALLLPHYLDMPKKEVSDLIDSHFVRAPIIKRAVDTVLRHACQGGHMMALHWRNRTGETCFHFSAADKVKEKCRKAIPEAAIAAEMVAHSVKWHMEKENTTCLFVAHPHYSKPAIDYFKKVIPGYRVIDSDIARELKAPETDRIKNDMYLMSLFDQEMCYRSKLFLRQRYSSWSDFIEEQRNVIGTSTMRIAQLQGLNGPEFRDYIQWV